MAKPENKPEKRFTEPVKCEHCSNRAPMEVVASYIQDHYKFLEEPREAHLEYTDNYQLLLCPECHRVTLRMFIWDDWTDETDVVRKILYPTSNRIPLGLSSSIKKDYEAALQVRVISPNAYGVLMGRVLELVCEDRKAKGRTLAEKLADLAAKGEIPDKLVRVANNLKNLRNIGAHAGLGDLTVAEVPILDDLCKAILEYVYSAPYLADQAEERLAKLKRRK